MATEITPLGLRWASRLVELAGQAESASTALARDAARAEIWRIFNFTIGGYLRRHAAKLGAFSREDLEDLTSQKSLELIQRLDSHTWNLAGLEAPEVPRVLSTVARNGLVDRLRKANRGDLPFEEQNDAEIATAAAIGGGASESAEARLERQEFVRALRRCAERLAERTRTIWLFRVLYEMSSKEIAAHPEVRLRAGHVDVILQRGRQSIRGCMKAAGHRPRDMPAGVFAELWTAFRLTTTPTRREQDER